MEDLICDLFGILTREADCYETLADTIRAERTFLTRLASDELGLNNDSKSRLIEDIRRFEAERQRIALELAGALKLPSESANLSSIAAVAPPPWNHRLNEVRIRLQHLTRAVLSANEQNRRLVEHSRRHFKRFLLTLIPNRNETETYRSSGIMRNIQPNSGRLVSRNA
ncbi:MAG: flagellar protein FlgN [Deltaproteobacteria bacterium]|nr:flagellar protein FlgN [Deltaproteobacteria bacterium]